MIRRSEGPTTLLVPTERHVERAGREGAVTLRRFFDRIAAEAFPERKPASRAARRLAARTALSRTVSSASLGRLFESSGSERAALVSALDATIVSLREAGTTADDLTRTGTPRGAELARLLGEVDRVLEDAGLADTRAVPSAGAITQALSNRPVGSITTLGLVRLRGISLAALTALSRASKRDGGSVTIRLPRFDDPDHPISIVAAAIEKRLATEDDAPDIEWLEPDEPVVRVVEARGPSAEARGVAKAVQEALDAGAAPEAIAICAPPGDEAILSPLRTALAEAGVPFSEARGRPASSIAEARAALSLLSMASRWITRDGLVELLSLPALHAGAFVGAREEQEASARAARLAHRLRALPIVRDTSGEVFASALRRGGAGPEDGGWAADATSRLCRAIVALRSASGVEELGRAWLALIERMRLGDPSAREISLALKSSSPGALGALGEGAVAVRALRVATEEIIDARRLVAVEQPFAADDLAAEIEIALGASRTSPSGGSARAGAVRIAGPEEIAGGEHELVVVTRLATSAYRPARGTSLLDEATRRKLPESRRPPPYRDVAAEREAELAWAARSARQVVLAFATTDDDGREAEPPHPIVARAQSAGAAGHVEPTSRLSMRASILSARGAELSGLAHGAAPRADLAPRVAIERTRQAFFLDPRAAPGPFTGLVPAPHARGLAQRFGGGDPEHATPVSAIEAAALCPFKAFAGRILRAQPFEDVGDPLSARERGELLHRALFAVYEADKALPPSATLEARLDAARAAGARAIALDDASGPLRREGKRRILAEAVALLADERSAHPDLVYQFGEQRFGAGEEEPWGPLALPHEPTADGDAPVWVEGRLDRVDLSPDGRRARVVDYKTGKSLPSMKALGVTAFQLPLYARVVARRRLDELSVTYLSATAVLTGHKRRDGAKVMTEAELDQAAERAAETVRGIWSGRVPPRPAHPSACKRCAARDLCRKPAVVPPSDDDDGGGS